LDALRHLGDGRGVRGPTERCVPQGGDPAGLELGAGGVEVALARRQMMGRPYLDDTAETEVRVVENPPDQIRAVESRGGTGGGNKVRLGEVEEGWREVEEGKGNAFGAGGNNIYTLAAVVGKGWAKGKGAIPVRSPSVPVFGTGESKTELARGVKRLGGEVV
jgi:hypothetical protein